MKIETKITGLTIASLSLGILTVLIAISNLDSSQSGKAAIWFSLTAMIMIIGFRIIYLKDELVERKVEELEIKFKITTLKTERFWGPSITELKTDTVRAKWQENRHLAKVGLREVDKCWELKTKVRALQTPMELSKESVKVWIGIFEQIQEGNILYQTSTVCQHINSMNRVYGTNYKITDIAEIIERLENVLVKFGTT